MAKIGPVQLGDFTVTREHLDGPFGPLVTGALSTLRSLEEELAAIEEDRKALKKRHREIVKTIKMVIGGSVESDAEAGSEAK